VSTLCSPPASAWPPPAVDASPTAIDHARAKARERGLTAAFLVADACDPAQLHGPYDTALDSGLLYALDP
jgi:2-polyprenyl-3-methyl-5-hydroxy-6-metoxy-1,4-benzoquinol methylase